MIILTPKILKRFKTNNTTVESLLHAQDRYIQQSTLKQEMVTLIGLYVSKLNNDSYSTTKYYEQAQAQKVSNEKIQTVMNLVTNSCASNAELTVLLEAAKDLNEHKDVPYLLVKRYLTEAEYIDFVMLVNNIGSWNRIKKAQKLSGTMK